MNRTGIEGERTEANVGGALAGVSFDTREFEVPAVLDPDGRISASTATAILGCVDRYGFAVVPGLLGDDECDRAMQILKATIDDPDRVKSSFASSTDIRHRRRDFCPLPSSDDVLDHAALLCRRLEPVLAAACGRDRRVLEISTLTSYPGCSHQYVHRDPEGVLCLFAAVADVSEAQGGTVFVPGTHDERAAAEEFGERAGYATQLYQARRNLRILARNLALMARPRSGAAAPLGWSELRDRTFSRRWDEHQPNLVRFVTAKNDLFDVRKLRPRLILDTIRLRRRLGATFRTVQATPARGTVMVYRSDMLHAGPDNHADRPRYFFNMNIARDGDEREAWTQGYTPHPTLREQPLTVGELVDRASPEASTAV